MRLTKLLRTFTVPVLLLGLLACQPNAAFAQATTRLQVNPGLVTNQVTLSTSAALVLASGQNFVARSICNTDATIIVYVGLAGVTTGTGYPVYPKTCTPPDLLGRSTAAVYVVAASGTPVAAGLQY